MGMALENILLWLNSLYYPCNNSLCIESTGEESGSWMALPSFAERLPQGKTIWDWLDLVGGTALLGIAASIISFFITQSNQETASLMQDRKERQQVLNDYIREMRSLIKTQKYDSMNSELKSAISTRTLNALEDLNLCSARSNTVPTTPEGPFRVWKKPAAG